MSNIKEDRNKQVMEYLKDHTQAEAAMEFEITRQRVYQIVESFGGLPESSPKYRSDQYADNLLGTMSDPDLARFLGKSVPTITMRRINAHIPAFRTIRPDTCPNCEINPYARGRCRSCYARLRRKEIKHGISNGTLSESDLSG